MIALNNAKTDLELQLLGVNQELLNWFRDDSITDILLNGLGTSFIERNGVLEEVPSPFKKSDELFHLIERLLLPIGKRVDSSNPYIDGALKDGSRFHLILPPIAPGGPLISIRKHSRMKQVELSDFGPPEVIEFLKEQIISRKNLLISGGTGAGKTTLLSRLLSVTSSEERILLVEETAEIQPQHPHVVKLETRTANPEGFGEVSLRVLIKNALRMRPDRLVVGECRGAEALEMLQAMNSGHGGSLGTLHASSARDALRRFETLCLFSGLDVPLKGIREWVGNNIHGVIHMARVDGKRCISEVLSVGGLEGEVYRVTPIYRRRDGVKACNV